MCHVTEWWIMTLSDMAPRDDIGDRCCLYLGTPTGSQAKRASRTSRAGCSMACIASGLESRSRRLRRVRTHCASTPLAACAVLPPSLLGPDVSGRSLCPLASVKETWTTGRHWVRGPQPNTAETPTTAARTYVRIRTYVRTYVLVKYLIDHHRPATCHVNITRASHTTNERPKFGGR